MMIYYILQTGYNHETKNSIIASWGLKSSCMQSQKSKQKMVWLIHIAYLFLVLFSSSKYVKIDHQKVKKNYSRLKKKIVKKAPTKQGSIMELTKRLFNFKDKFKNRSLWFSKTIILVSVFLNLAILILKFTFLA